MLIEDRSGNTGSATAGDGVELGPAAMARPRFFGRQWRGQHHAAQVDSSSDDAAASLILR